MIRRNRARVWWRARGRRPWRTFTQQVIEHDLNGGWLIIGFAAFIGAMAGYAVIGFYGVVDAVRELAGWTSSTAGLAARAAWIPFVLVPLGLFIAATLRRSEDADSGQMVPLLIRVAAKRGGALPIASALRRVASAAVTIGSGGSLGAEGPVSVVGATIGSGVGQGLRFGPNRVRVLLGCGTAAGISAAFGAPIAGVLFSLEVVLGTFSVGAMSPIMVASVMGAVVAQTHLGGGSIFVLPGAFEFSNPVELVFYALLGLGCGLLAAAFVRVFFGTQDVLNRRLTSRLQRAVGAGLILAAAGLLHPELLGDGRSGIDLVFAGRLSALALLSLGALKMLTSGLTVAGGGAGGVFTPALFVGASFGALFGQTLGQLFPSLGVTPGAYALAGMAGLTAGATFAPLTAILIIVEMTNDYGLVIPLMLVCILSYLIARRVHGESLYTEELVRSGEHISHGADKSVLENVRVSECYNRDPDVVLEDAPLRKVLGQFKGSRQTAFPVVTPDLGLVGMLTYQEISRALDDAGLMDILIAADLTAEGVETVTPRDSLLDAMRLMGVRGLDYLPVIESPEQPKLLGLLSRGQIMDAYQTRLLFESPGPRLDARLRGGVGA